MNFSGRSVEAASRVIEIEEVLVPTIASGFRLRAEVGEDLALDVFLLGRRLDDEIAVAELVERVGRRDARERGLAVFLGDQLARDLPRQIAVDGREPGIDAVGRDVVEQNVHSGKRDHMRNAVTHLTGADDADLFDCNAMFSAWPRAAAPGRSLTCVIVAIWPFYDDPALVTTGITPDHCPRFPSSFGKLRQRLIEVGDQAVVGDLEDRRLLVLVDRHDHLGVLHAGEMLDRA